ncbi:MAG: GntR family transcriptional regulator [Chloroflexota bacterium]
MFKRNPSLVEQIKTHLKQRIVNAEFESGRIPPEADLANELGVSRNTVRDALSRLELEGAIFRKQGAGTFVNKAVFLVKTRLEEILPYEAMIREYGFNPTIRLVSVDEEPADPKIADDLGLVPDQNVLVVQKLFLADDKPVIFTRTFIPPQIINCPYTADDLREPVYHFLPKFCRQEFAYYLSEIMPIIAPAWLAGQLAIPPEPLALISFEEIGYNQNNEPLVKAYSYFRSDLLRLRLIRRRTH